MCIIYVSRKYADSALRQGCFRKSSLSVEETKTNNNKEEEVPKKNDFLPYICIAGIIGAGKSTLAEALAKALELPLYKESAQDDPYLKLFYESGTKQYGYQLQISLLTKRFEQQQKIIWNGNGAVQDRTIYEDAIFCKMLYESGNISELDYTTYKHLSKIMFNLCGKPGVIIHLDISPEEALQRMKIRNRDIEKALPLEYLNSLHKAYEDWLMSMKEVRIIRVKYDKYSAGDYTNKIEFDKKMSEIAEKIANDIKEELKKSNIVSI